jgi:SP family general alpha glucoside:H+ symporter-like MFS transporter
MYDAGSFIGTGVTTGAQRLSSDWSWRLPYATQWIWPVPLIIFMSFAPESPWWLVRQGNLHAAEKSVRRLASAEMRDKAKDTVANMASPQ